MDTPSKIGARQVGELGEVDKPRHPRDMTAEDRYLSLRELSHYSGLSVNALRRIMRDQGLIHYKLPDRILVRRSDFDAWAARYRRGERPTHVGLFDD